MSFNYDFTRADGTEVLVCYRLIGGGSDFVSGGCWHPGDALEVEFEPRVYGLPKGEKLTDEEYEKIEAAILANPPEYYQDPSDVF